MSASAVIRSPAQRRRTLPTPPPPPFDSKLPLNRQQQQPNEQQQKQPPAIQSVSFPAFSWFPGNGTAVPPKQLIDCTGENCRLHLTHFR